MAIEAGRVGVRADQVDPYGRIKDGGGGTDPAVEKLEEQVGSYSFRTNPEDGSAQYRQSDDGDWVNFSSGGISFAGFRIPSALVRTENLTLLTQNAVFTDGGYYLDEDNNILYVDISLHINSDISANTDLFELPVTIGNQSGWGISDVVVNSAYSEKIVMPYSNNKLRYQSWLWAGADVRLYGMARYA